MKNFTIHDENKIEPGFKIPDNYFEDFSGRLTKQLPKKTSKIFSLYAKKKSWLYATAAILVVGLSISFYWQITHNQNIESDSIEYYLQNNTVISDDDFATILDDTDFNNINITADIDNESIENELIKDYNLEQTILE